MHPSLLSPRPSACRRVGRYAMFAVTGAAALTVAACGSSPSTTGNTTKSPAASASPSASAPQSPSAASTPTSGAPDEHGKDHVMGQVASISGNAIQVTAKNGNATVDFGPSTKIAEVTSAKLSDVAAGNCIMVIPSNHEGGGSGAVTARRVMLNTLNNGTCGGPQHKERSESESPGPSRAPHERPTVRGTVVSVNGNTIVVSSPDNNGSTAVQTDVTVTNDTAYTKRASADAAAITAGKCIAARGSDDSSGALQATMINLRTAENGSCGEHHER